MKIKLFFSIFVVIYSLSINAQMNPYLQTPTSTSMYISWHCTESSSTIVNYGINKQLKLQAEGNFENIGGKIWHTTFLTDLKPDTEYFYSCRSGNQKTEIYSFRTPFEVGQSDGKHFVFVVVGDNRTDTAQTAYISRKIEEKLIELYGKDWQNSVRLMLNVGDINTDGNNIEEYENEFFIPFRNLTCKIPTMVSIGNHERESNFFYKYMKYENLTAGNYPVGNKFNERFYNFQLANCLFISLNSNWQLRNNEQLNWLDNVMLQSSYNDSIDYIFSFFHHPGRSEVWPDGNTNYVQNNIYNILNRYHKQEITFYGHSHNYEHGILETDIYDNENKHDSHLILCGGGGSSLDRWGAYENQIDYPEIYLAYDHYCWTLIDIDLENKSYTGTTYSLGHPDKLLDNIVIDNFSRKKEKARPSKPENLKFEDNILKFEVANKNGIFSTQFLISKIPGNYEDPIYDIQRDITNIFKDTGKPDYCPINLNKDIDIYSLELSEYELIEGHKYAFIVRVRNKNLQWSKWSEEKEFMF